jgi:hypothetical protein
LAAESHRDVLAVLDEEVSQRENEDTLTPGGETSAAPRWDTPWWEKFSTAKNTRERILKGQEREIANKAEFNRKRKASENLKSPRKKRKNKRREAFEEQTRQQEEDLVDNTW